MALLALAAVRAIRAFQTNQGLPVTGLIDRKVLTGGSSNENERASEVAILAVMRRAAPQKWIYGNHQRNK
jgi:murein L,D-transpeptidase YcbB/YkuD